jgi:hypothetical protein
MLGPGGLPILRLRGRTPHWRIQTNCGTAAIELIDQHTLERLVSPELMLVDSELAERARALLREPHESNNGKGNHMSALGTHEFTAGTSLGLEPPLSPPVVRGPMASAMPVGDGGLSELPTPPPAIRPPEAAPAPIQAEVPQQPEPAAAPAPAPAPAQAPEPVQLEPAVPQMAPEPAVEPAAPVIDYFATEAPAPEPAPVEELPAIAPAPPAEPEPAPAVELHTIPLMAPAEPAPAPEPAAAAPVELPAVELPAVSPEPVAPAIEPEPVPVAIEPEPIVEPEPVAFVAPPPVELTPEPAPEPVVEPVAAAQPVRVPELDELFAPKRTTDFRVVVRLKDAEGVEVGSFRDFGTAMEGAQEVIEQFSSATEGQWPFYAGRFIRPDLIVSVDVVEGGDEL